MPDCVISPAAAEALVVDVLTSHNCTPANAVSVAKALVAA